jgi:hypothetical protein
VGIDDRLQRAFDLLARNISHSTPPAMAVSHVLNVLISASHCISGAATR